VAEAVAEFTPDCNFALKCTDKKGTQHKRSMTGVAHDVVNWRIVLEPTLEGYRRQ
jgi:hypothetical protein